jgi:hypothetical protein
MEHWVEILLVYNGEVKDIIFVNIVHTYEQNNSLRQKSYEYDLYRNDKLFSGHVNCDLV